MSSAVVAGTTSTSCFPTFSKNQSLKTTKSFISSHHQKTIFQGLSLQDGRRGCSDFFMPNNNCSNLINGRTGLQVTARTAGAAKTIEVEVDKPLGLTLGQKSGGGVVITGVEGGGNAAKAGLKAGDQVLYTSSFFGDELWPADKLGFTKTAIQAKPDSIYFVVSRYCSTPFQNHQELKHVTSIEMGSSIFLQNRGAEVDVKRLPKRPAPPRFGRKLTETQKACFFSFFFPSMSNLARATHICIDCGFIYTLQKPFDDQARFINIYTKIYLFFSCFMQPDAYVCPQCRAPKKRFARYDVNTGRAVGGGLPPIGVIIGLVAGIGGVGALLVYGLQ
ncbi:hypothetical protein DKX38_029292 [Salix brachista]|uniref:PDZ domain-containing protein n=1 Tax=Salix brachista TaxID=2182728 RepID=A0A5N5J383_9ROSI|nr:hypothetical protein DKX38_029292 [Salix brachista]